MLGLPRAGSPHIEIRDVVARLIAMDVHSEDSLPCNIFCLSEIFIVKMFGEESVQP